MFRITSEIALADRDVDERFVPLAASRARKRTREISGVELRLDILSASLPEEVKTRLLALRDRRVTSDGVLVVISRAYASQERNREAARTRLADIIRGAATPIRERRPIARVGAPRPSRTTGRSHSAASRAVKGDPG